MPRSAATHRPVIGRMALGGAVGFMNTMWVFTVRAGSPERVGRPAGGRGNECVRMGVAMRPLQRSVDCGRRQGRRHCGHNERYEDSPQHEGTGRGDPEQQQCRAGWEEWRVTDEVRKGLITGQALPRLANLIKAECIYYSVICKNNQEKQAYECL